ncbi:MAG: hypothetical protein ACRDRH_14350 [Pseudonocardia sp.]
MAATGQQYNTVRRENWLLSRAEDRLATVTEIAQAIPALYGTEISVNTIRSWVPRPHPGDRPQGRRLGGRTTKIIEGNGFKVDWLLWEADYAKCTPCHQGSNCH